ncbi:hypothetical protein MATL_G00056210 [Megalops atlanticus]|uniref:Uncharacterized protein n=1 Tax=Megalops atlanticus TaxID=7932 RepID=A0A9D3T9S1_MEGAT|nr:hypothetical protein MATL_G00056210 [Megalops atlanticus]
MQCDPDWKLGGRGGRAECHVFIINPVRGVCSLRSDGAHWHPLLGSGGASTCVKYTELKEHCYSENI